jgi:hypothetical protein
MAFLEEIEGVIRSAYFEIVKRYSLVSKQDTELNCGSYAYITKEIKSILIECNRNGFNVLDTTNKIIYELLQKNYFVYNNHVMAAFIGYQYLKRMAQIHCPFSINGIKNNSTIMDIANHTKMW